MKPIILIPAHNEAKAIGPLVEEVRQSGFVVVVVDDGSVDNTSEIAQDNGALVIKTPKKSGKGKALQFGFDYCLKTSHPAVIVMDGDGQHAPSDLGKFVACFEKTGAGIVTGNRMEDHKDMPPVRLATNRLMSWIISSVCKQAVPDTQCGYRLISMKALTSITIECSDFEIETEILIKASKKGFKIESIPIQTIYGDEVSKIRPIKDTIRFIQYITKEIFRGNH